MTAEVRRETYPMYDEEFEFDIKVCACVDVLACVCVRVIMCVCVCMMANLVESRTLCMKMKNLSLISRCVRA
jgi:hypothetical protein